MNQQRHDDSPVLFDVRVDFFRELPDDRPPQGYVGSALRDGLAGVVVPRVGEYVHGLGPSAARRGRYGGTGPYSVVAAVEHTPSPTFKGPLADGPKVCVVVWALWPGDGPMAGSRMLADYDKAGGWRLMFFSDHAPVQPFPGQPGMGGT